jgi:cytochrome P450
MLTPKQAETFRPIQEFESKQMAVDWLDSPQDYYQHTRRYAFSLIMQITYGRRFPKFGSKDAEGVYEANKHFATVATPGAYLVDTFPILAKIPGYGTIFGTWRKVAEELFQMDSQAFLGYYRRMKDELKRGVGHPCFARDLEQIDEEHGIDELERAYLAIGLVQPGAESTAALLNWLVRALATWPEVQIDAREELDRVIGFDRTPNWEDEQQLPYLRAMVKELLRWALGTKFGVPHRLTKDDWYGSRRARPNGRYEGMFIPKGTRVVLGQCGLHYDDQRYPEPWRYNPSRYLGTKMLQKSAYENMFSPNYEEDRDHWGYGAGRRYCPGTLPSLNFLHLNSR